MSRKRRSYEAGHKPKYLVVIDDTPECDRAVYYASRRSARNGADMVMLRVIEITDRNQQWLGVADIMRAEAQEEAQAVLARFAARAKSIADTCTPRTSACACGQRRSLVSAAAQPQRAASPAGASRSSSPTASQ